MKSLKYIFSLIFLYSVINLSGQNAANLIKKGDNAFSDGEYYTAIQYYLQVSNDSGSVTSMVYPFALRNTAFNITKDVDVYAYISEKLAESYRKVFDYINAAKWYDKTIALKGQDVNPDTYFWYGTMLRASGKYDEALVQFNKFKESSSTNEELKAKLDNEIKNCEFAAESMKYPETISVEKLSSTDLNNDLYSNYASSFDLGDTDSYYLTTTRYTREGKNKKETPYVNKVAMYYSGGYINPIYFYNEDNKMDMGTPTLTEDAKRMYVTKWDGGDINSTYKIYLTYKLNDTSWSDLIDLGDKVNSDSFKTREPYVSKNGSTLYFSSNREGGQGGYDLYKIALNLDGIPATEAEVINLGTNVNSEMDEFAPFLDENSNTFYFTSKGRVGMGGLDIFKSKIVDDEMMPAQNMGYPINSHSDDSYMSITFDSARGYLSSDRIKGCCYDLFHFEIGKIYAYGFVINSLSNKTPISGAKLKLMDSLGNVTYDSTIADENGKYYFRDLKLNKPYKVVASKKDFFDAFAYFTTKGTPINDSVQVPPIDMFTSKVGESVVLDNIFYDYDKATLRPESMFALDKLAIELKKRPNLVVEISSHTDSKGSDKYNMKLSQERSQSVVDYLISVGIKKENMVAKGYGETKPLLPNSNADGSDNANNRQINRRTEFKILSDGNILIQSDGKMYDAIK